MMGIEYYVQDLKHGRKFELGKGPMGDVFAGLDVTLEDMNREDKPWYLAVRERPRLSLDDIRAAGVDELARRFVAAWRVWESVGWAKFDDDVDFDDYMRDLARRLWRFCELAGWRVKLWDDTAGPPRGGSTWWDSPVVDTAYADGPEHGGVDRLES